jgi:hypothetical protein
VADDFGTTIYTSCAPGQGLTGAGGMQFQTQSPGLDREALALIRHHLIYEPPDQLIREQQPIEAFPPSFAHVYEGIFVTAAGVYIGREADGLRQGNHLTHAIVARHATAYRSVRPAQLFHAPFWRSEPAPTTHSERLVIPSNSGQLGATEAKRFVNAQPDGTALLTSLLDALLAFSADDREVDSRRVLFIAENPDSVLSWLAAATLLIPHERALRIGFKVFVTDPARSALPVVAVHPDWTRSTATVEDDHGYAVFDLRRHCWTAVRQTPAARHWARLFCQADPIDVSDAVELAAASGLPGDAARDLATAAILGTMPALANAEALVRWLQTGPPALREAYGGRLLDALAQLGDPRLLRRIDDIAADQFPGRSDSMRLTLLRRELESALHSPALRRSSQPSARQPSRTVSEMAEPEATQLVADYLDQARGRAFDAVLRVGAQFGVSVALDKVHSAVSAFVASWASDPSAGYDPLAWPPAPPVYSMLLDELTRRINSRPSIATTIADQWWDRLGDWAPEQADIASPLQRALLAAAMANSDHPRRTRIVTATLRRAGSTDAASYEDLAATLWSRSSALTSELRVLSDIVPAGTYLDPRIFDDLITRATGNPVGLPELEVCEILGTKGFLPLDAAISELVSCHRTLQDIESRPDIVDSRDLSAFLYGISPRLVSAHARPLARSLLTISEPMRAAALAHGLPPMVAVAYVKALANNDGVWSTPAWMAVSFSIFRLPDPWWHEVNPTGDLRAALIAKMREKRDAGSRKQAKKESKAVADLLVPLGGNTVLAWKNDAGDNRRLGFVTHIASAAMRKQPD